MKTSKPVAASKVIMTQLVLPSHTNSLGTIFGGTIMSWIDIAAAISAQRHSNREVVTASIDRLDFIAPVYTGWVVNLKASVNYTSRTSMEVGVRVDAENPKTGEVFHTASAYCTFVALGSNGKPSEIPELTLQTDDDKRRYEDAKKRREVRLANKAR
ncbi:acyl-CoA thioesterase [Bdellovibrio reynosensis]|uniref:Acyl-CoA thioesterase n=2 Tax=Bdellovibrio reynosensis TaxID=2835041 RepID=A0ABY4CF18_9BACT|nr:acyl-CoA thioesterase [Bdellovibrio reynosensis]UOF02143.1 acyl-CoA thioesterase [Bdellovibrio reynosensis]